MKNLKELREYNNLTQKEVAQHIGVSDRVYSYYEKGRTLPAKYVKPLANLFGISCDEFLDNLQDERVWHKEFGCIEIPKRLSLPTWEEVEEIIKSADAGTECIVCFEDYSIEYTKYNCEYLGVYKDCVGILATEPTREGYIKCCRKLKLLLLGEKK